MGIPGLINALGAGERVALSKLAVSHLEREHRPIRVAVDISIWLFQVQAGRGGKNPEMRTLFYRLIKLLALPIHPLFVYDGSQKPPFKRGKSTTSRGHGNAPIIQRSKDLISRFRFPWHDAPGEAEAECARLQQAGIVDVVMSDDIDTLMFGASFMIKNFSKENGTSTAAATHVTCYNMSSKKDVSNVPFDRPGMILFAMLSGGDYLPSGVPKCGSKLAAEIAKAGFGEDLLEIIASPLSDLDSKLNEWRDRLQFELEENESGYFTTKHKAVRIPPTFPDHAVLQYYAEPIVSTKDEMEVLRNSLRSAWDKEIDPIAIRSFAAEHLEWNYRSGARKVIKLLAEPLISYRLRLKQPVSGLAHGTLAPECDTPWLQKIHRSRANFGTDGMTELQTDMLPIDVVGIDLLAETPNPQPLPEENEDSQNKGQPLEEEDEADATGEAPPPQTPSKARVTRRYDPLGIEKVWIFETVARIGAPELVQKWDDEQARKAAAKAAPKKTTSRRTGPRKKGPIDPGMKRGSILKYGTLTKERSEISPPYKTQLLEAATSISGAGKPFSRDATTLPGHISLEDYHASPSMYSKQDTAGQLSVLSQEMDDLVGSFSNLCAMSPTPTSKTRPRTTPLRMRSRTSLLATGDTEFEDFEGPFTNSGVATTPSRRRREVESSALASTRDVPKPVKGNIPSSCIPISESPARRRRERPHEVDELERAIGSLSLVISPDCSPSRPSRKHASVKKAGLGVGSPISSPKKPETRTSSSKKTRPAVPSGLEGDTECLPLKQAAEKPKTILRSPKKATKNLDPKPNETIGHIENVTTCNGFWEIDASEQPVAKPDAADSQDSRSKKKRLPRVSILDMI